MSSLVLTELRLPGAREVVDLPRLRALLSELGIPAPSASELQGVRRVCLSNKAVTSEAAELLALTLRCCGGVVQADISDMIAGRPEEDALKALAHVCGALGREQAVDQLLEVNVSDNAFGVKGMTAVMPVLLGANLQSVHFCNNGMSAEASEMMARLLLTDVPQSLRSKPAPPLHTLHFFNNMSGDAGGFAVGSIVRQMAGTIRDIRFSATRCMAAGCKDLCQALGEVRESQLLRLDLQDNNFGPRGLGGNGLLLAQSLQTQMHCIQYLNLRDANLGDEAILSILEAGSSTYSGAALRVLDLSGNELTPACLPRLCAVLGKGGRFGESLEHLSLDDNDELIGHPEDEDDDDDEDDESPKEKNYLKNINTLCSKLLRQSTSLTAFSLATCNLSSASAFLVHSAIIEAMSHRNDVVSFRLNLNGNRLSAACIALLQESVSGLQLAELDDNDEVDDEEDDLKAGRSLITLRADDDLVGAMNAVQI
jgi:Ran GTPase-activating protein (RanGAP) involved in mRNA processing and transport